MLRTTSTIGISAILLLAMASTVAAQEESSATPEADGSPSPLSDEVMRLGNEVGPLEPGTYADDSLGPEVRFSVGAGWEMSGEPIDDVGVQLGQQGIEAAAVTITRFPGTVFAEPCVQDEDFDAYFADTQDIEASAQGFVDHLAANPFLALEEPTAIELGGWSGLQVDLTSSIPEADCQPPVTFLWELPVVGEFHLVDQESARAIALDVGEDVVVIFIEANPGVDWPAFLEASMPLVESVSITSPDAGASPATTEG